MSWLERRIIWHLLWGRLRWMGLQGRAVSYWFTHDADTVASVKRGLADSDAGRTYRGRRMSRLPDPPSPSWSRDDPQQPDGWYHDGRRWRLRRDGWFRDPYGFWRYNHPGDPGWQEQPNGWWRYVKREEELG